MKHWNEKLYERDTFYFGAFYDKNGIISDNNWSIIDMYMNVGVVMQAFWVKNNNDIICWRIRGIFFFLVFVLLLLWMYYCLTRVRGGSMEWQSSIAVILIKYEPHSERTLIISSHTHTHRDITYLLSLNVNWIDTSS